MGQGTKAVAGNSSLLLLILYPLCPEMVMHKMSPDIADGPWGTAGQLDLDEKALNHKDAEESMPSRVIQGNSKSPAWFPPVHSVNHHHVLFHPHHYMKCLGNTVKVETTLAGFLPLLQIFLCPIFVTLTKLLIHPYAFLLCRYQFLLIFTFTLTNLKREKK